MRLPPRPSLTFMLSGVHRPAAVGEAFPLDAPEDGVELRIAHHERVMVAFEVGIGVEIEGKPVVHPDLGEMRHRALVFEPEDAGEEPCGFFLVARRNDGVVEDDGHRAPPTHIRFYTGSTSANTNPSRSTTSPT